MAAVRSVAVALLLGHAVSNVCPPADFSSVDDFDLNAFVNGRWFVHQQMEIGYLPKWQNRCVYAEYTQTHDFWGYNIHVRRYAQDNAEPHTPHDTDKVLDIPDRGGYCAKVEDAKHGQMKERPCLLPRWSLLGPYWLLPDRPMWVLAFDATEGYALVSGGPPKNRATNGCSTGKGVSSSGLWVYTRSAQRDEALIQKVRGIAQSKGFDLSVLNDVDHTNCDYNVEPRGQATMLV